MLKKERFSLKNSSTVNPLKNVKDAKSGDKVAKKPLAINSKSSMKPFTTQAGEEALNMASLASARVQLEKRTGRSKPREALPAIETPDKTSGPVNLYFLPKWGLGSEKRIA